jgi:hypothetical protein
LPLQLFGYIIILLLRGLRTVGQCDAKQNNCLSPLVKWSEFK